MRVPVNLQPRGVERWLPFLAWARGYSRGDLRRDLEAGLLVSLVSVPSALGYAQLAGIPPERGLNAIFYAGLVFTFLSSSRQLAVGPTGFIAALVAVGIGAPEVSGERAVALASTLALMVGAILGLMSLLRMGRLTQFVSRPVSLGYMLGVVVTIAAVELGPILGLELERRHFLPALDELLSTRGELASGPALFGLATLLLFALIRRIRPTVAPFATLLAATAAVVLFDLQESGVEVVGKIPAAAFDPVLPSLATSDLRALGPDAVVIAAFVFLDSVTTAAGLARRAGYEVRPNQELLALGAINAAAGVGGGLPVGGNTGDTELSESIRARSPVAGLVVVAAAALVLLVGPTLPNLPFAALSVVAIGGVVNAFPWRLVPPLFRASRSEAVLLLTAVGGVLLIGPLRGLLIAVLASMLHLLWLSSRPRVEQLGTNPSRSDVWVDLARAPDGKSIPFVLVVRVDSALLFTNIEQIAREILALVADASKPTELVVLELSAVNFVDVSAYLGLEELHRNLARQRVRLVAANANLAVAERLAHFTRIRGVLPTDFVTTGIAAAIEKVRRTGPPASSGA